MKSKFLSLHAKDVLKGFLIAILTAILTGVYNAINAGSIEFTWAFFKPILMTSVAAGIAYLLKNWLTNSDDVFLKSENKG